MSAPTTLDDDVNEIPSILIPIAQKQLLIPTVSVAEMVPFQTPQPDSSISPKDQPNWFLGNLYWRGVKVPMFSFEAMSGDSLASIKPDSQVVILNSIGVSAKVPFLCFPTQGIPHLSRVMPNEISEITNEALSPCDLMQVAIAGSQAIIPNLEKIEQSCIESLGLT